MSTISQNMLLTIPTVGVTLGPTYATQVNSALNIIDAHDHTAGRGVPITPSGININADLPFSEHNLTNVRSVRFLTQGSPLGLSTDLDCIYTSGVDLYYNDGNGNVVRITSGGGVAGTPGSITNLVSPASATYVSGSQTFVWQSDANTPANMDGGSVIIRDVLANSPGITISAPGALATDYTLTLPAIPIEQTFMTLDPSGNMQVPAYDHTTLSVTPSLIKAIPNGLVDNVTTQVVATKLAVRNGYAPITFAALGPFGIVIQTYPEQAVGGVETVPYNYQIMNIIVELGSASTGVPTTFDILVNGSSILSTLPSFATTVAGITDSGTIYPVTAGITKPIVGNAFLTAGDLITMNITSASSTAANATITLIVSQR